ILVARVGVGIRVADVAESGGAEQSVGHGVEDDVGVRVPDQSARMLNAQTGENQRAIRAKAMRGVAEADAEHKRSSHGAGFYRWCGDFDNAIHIPPKLFECSMAKFSKRMYCLTYIKVTSPVGPLRCLATITSTNPSFWSLS